MSIRLILPKNAVYVESHKKVFFLAGPILGGSDWQRDAIRLLAERVPESYVACPCRYTSQHPLHSLSVEGENVDTWKSRGLMPISAPWSIPFPRQTYWERFYLSVASRQGCVIFWLPGESRLHPRPPEKGPYARDTYGELGEWRMRMRYENARIVIGAEQDFPGLSVIEANYRATLGDAFAPETTLEKTIDAAVAKAK